MLVFNGDFNWFNTAPAGILRVNGAVRAECDAGRAIATAGNVELELASSAGTGAVGAAGCGCAYPGYVGDGVVGVGDGVPLSFERPRTGARIVSSIAPVHAEP